MTDIDRDAVEQLSHALRKFAWSGADHSADTMIALLAAKEEAESGLIHYKACNEQKSKWVTEEIESRKAAEAEAAALREALQNYSGYLDTPIARRKLGIDPDAEWLIAGRSALDQPKEGDEDE